MLYMEPTTSPESPSDISQARARQRGERIGRWVRDGLAARNINRKEGAKRCGISQTYFGILCNDCLDPKTDKYIRPSEEKIRQVAAGLAIDVEEGLRAAEWLAVPNPPGGPSSDMKRIYFADGSFYASKTPISANKERLLRRLFEVATEEGELLN